MRLSLVLILPLLASAAGCSLFDDSDKAQSDIMLRLPAADMTKAQADAATACAPYKKGAQLKDVISLNGTQVAEFACK